MSKTISLGCFTVSGGKLMLSDPCYSRGTWCHRILKNVKDGVWNASVVTDNFSAWGNRVARLVVNHVDHTTHGKLSRLRDRLGVDSGQLGIFCESKYPQGECGKYGDTTTFYGRACEVTSPAGIVDEGVVSSSGFGDGCYKALVAKENGKVTHVEVVFIDENEK